VFLCGFVLAWNVRAQEAEMPWDTAPALEVSDSPAEVAPVEVVPVPSPALPALSTRMINLKYVTAEEAVAAIKKFLSPRGTVEVFELPNKSAVSLFVQDMPDRLAAIDKLIETVDTPIPPINVTVNYSEASLVDVLRSLSADTKINIIAGKDVSGTVTVHLVDVPLDKALDAILLSNGFSYIREGTILRVVPVAELPVPQAEEMVTQVFTLKYANAEDLKATLEKIINKDGMVQIFSRSAVMTNKPRPNTIIVKDKPLVIKTIAAIIADVDKEPVQILIEAKFISVSLDDADKQGIDWAINAAVSGSRIPTTFPLTNNMGKGRLVPGVDPTDDTFAQKNMFPYSTSEDFSFGALDFAQTGAVLKMLNSKTDTKIISSPRVSATDGEEALINVGVNYPIPMYERTADSGSQYISGYEEIKIGVILRVTPYTVGDNRIMLKLHPEVSEISGYTGPNNERPITSTKEVSTSVSVVSGSTIIIGGLMKEDITDNKNQVPFLGSIPFLGAPFRYKEKTTAKTELLIFLTPHIIRKDAPLDQIPQEFKEIKAE
jgi:type IV pilus assembly protein PilQ